jgi:hypothetical protein
MALLGTFWFGEAKRGSDQRSLVQASPGGSSAVQGLSHRWFLVLLLFLFLLPGLWLVWRRRWCVSLALLFAQARPGWPR